MSGLLNLADIADHVERELNAAEARCGRYQDDPSGWHARHRAELAALSDRLAEQLGARVTDRWDGARVRIAGIAATSTSGTAGALRNWLRAARGREASA